jgi:hypothetical protein
MRTSGARISGIQASLELPRKCQCFTTMSTSQLSREHLRLAPHCTFMRAIDAHSAILEKARCLADMERP